MRTAPVPNIPAIPGMNPGAWVAGGGGDGGGGSGDEGNGSGDGQSANGNNGGNGAPSDGRDGDACGPGSGGGCPSHSPHMSAGHPVDPCTGDVFTETFLDLALGGHFPVRFQRLYHTTSRERDAGFGFGWTHSYSHEIEVRRRTILLWKSDGSNIEFPAVRVGERAVGRYGYVLERREWGYLLDCGDYKKRYFSEAADGGQRYRLTAVEDHNGNRHTVGYHKGALAQIVDPAGRTIRFSQDSRRRVVAIDVEDPVQTQWIRFARFVYDDAGNLVESTDADGHRNRFRYDEDHRLVEHELPTGLVFHFVYDARGRCTETWGAYADGRPEPGLAADLPETLADGATRAKGIYHTRVVYGDDGYSECIDSIRVVRCFANAFGALDKATVGGGVVSRTYDALGFETSKTDPAGATWKTDRDDRGRPVRFVDPLGAVKTVERNEMGRPVEIVDEYGGIKRYEYDLRGNVVREIDALGGVTTFDYDDRGQLVRRVGPNGAARVFVYDKFTNLVEVRRANGAVWRYEHNGLGQRTAEVAPDGTRREHGLSLRGDPRWTADEDGQVTRFETDARGKVRRVIEPTGATFDLDYTGVDWLAETRRPTGETVRFRCSRDGLPLELYNPKGERHTFVFGADRHIERETTFDGRTIHYKHDPRGLLLQKAASSGDRLDYEYDDAGQPIKVTDQDDNETRYAWDPAGNLTGAETARTKIELERNLMGGVVVERQVVDGEEVAVTTSYNAVGNKTRVQSSLGYDVAFEIDAMCEQQRALLDGEHPVEIERDLSPLEVARKLPGGAVVRTERDRQGRPVRRVIEGPEAWAAAGGEPQWMGRVRPGTHEVRYQWSASGELAGVDDSERGSTQLEYDPAGRLIRYAPSDLPEERFSYDANGNPQRSDAFCQHGPGDRLLRRGETEYVWDDAGRLVEKRIPRPASAEAPAGVDVWRYAWLPNGTLEKVTRPDGVVVELVHDAFARRLLKRVVDPRAGTVERTRYVWDQDALIQEVTTRTRGGVTVRVRQRDYWFDHLRLTPSAHADVTFDEAGEVAGRTWYHYVTDPFGFPERLVDARGQIACTLRRSAFGGAAYAPGARTSTPIRKLGQYHDEETGLHYCRFRYYDPETGRFLSPDPRGVHGSINAYTLGRNPIRWDDPFGLTTESDRTAQLKQGDTSRGQDCYAVGRLDDGSTMITRNGNGSMPAPRVRDNSEWKGQRREGDNPEGAITQGEFKQTEGTGDKICDHAERRMIREAEDSGRKIESISATNNCCANCKKALIEHNKDIVITDPNGNQVHP